MKSENDKKANNNKKRNLIILAVILNAVGITLTSFLIGYVKIYLYSLIFAVIALLDVLFIVGVYRNVEWLYKFVLTCYYIGIVMLALFLAVVRSGVIAQFYNEQGEIQADLIVAALRGKKGAVAIFIVLSFLQVTFLPVPSVVTTLVGAALFGIVPGMIYSLIGQVSGSMVAFWLGKIFGKKIIIWIVGNDAFNKYNEMIRGRDKIVIMFMLLFPFFPDDLLCMFAGLTSFTGLTFFFIILFSRLITITYTSLGYGVLDSIRALGPWSYVIYAAAALLVLLFFYFVWKRGEGIEKSMLKFIDKITPKRFKKKHAHYDETALSAPIENAFADDDKPFSDYGCDNSTDIPPDYEPAEKPEASDKKSDGAV